MDGRELDKKMRELWRNATGEEYAPGGVALPDDVRRANGDTLRFLRENFSKAEDDWKSLLSAKDAQLRDLAAQLEETRLLLEEMRARWNDARENAYSQEAALAAGLEESKKLMEAQKANHAKETALLKELLERSKTELVSMQERLDALRRERDEWRKKSDERGLERSEMADAKAGVESQLSGAKEAVERTLSELLAERRGRKEDQAKIKDLEAKAAELSRSLDNARQNWDAERTQWREMWDRERSVWETHRQEFAVWEERLRSEREAWSLKMRELESKNVEGAAGLAAVLKESSQWSEKVSQVLKLYALKGVELPKAFVSAGAAPARTPARTLARPLALALAALLLLGAGAWKLNEHRSKVHYKLLSRAALDLPNPSGFAVARDGVWFADWEKGLVLKDIRTLATVKAYSSQGGVPLRPAAMAAAPGGLWALDMAQLRYVLHDPATGLVGKSVKSPGPAPQSAAWDGYSLWAFDASSGLLYKYAADPEEGPAASYRLAGVKSVACMQWQGNRLWVLDDRNILRRYAQDGEGFSQLSAQELKMPAPSAFWLDEGKLWVLGRAGTLGKGYELRIYSLKSYI